MFLAFYFHIFYQLGLVTDVRFRFDDYVSTNQEVASIATV